ncbi:K02A2.6-like [Cordylochernes scorpioides]|uniref:RNA-directed DNA polymerase n=1 Tax=Cordylochernes scorpioides TaxID=51811 RepID=A0ABY6KS68_9ARAC|nr:K02A2.6-like [Cordylochernes scorpioides]
MDEKNETQDAEEDTAEGENNPAVSTPKIEPPPPSAELPAVLARLAACLSALQTTSDRVTHRTEIEVQSFDGTYPAAQFFRTYDQKTDWDGLTNTEKVLRLPRYLNNKPLEHFRRLRMETQHYIQVRQTFLDLYPETNEATYAQYFSMKLAGQPNLEEYYRNKTALGLQLGLPQEVILETLTEGLPPSDQRLVRIVPPENLGAWFRLVQRIRGSGAPSPRHPDEHAPPLLGPYAPVPPVRIATNSDKVVTIRPYRVPICDQREIRSQIRQMLDNDIIEPSYSPFSSPVTLVTKRDKTKRFCIDYRKVNEVISSDVHPLPRIEDILDRLARAKYFSTADVSSAYWQVPIHPDSRPLLAFATIDGLYQPTRLPFGLKTSPQIYERAINQVLQGHGLDCVAHYFDDFVIYSETLEEHQEHLRRFFAFCDAENLQLNLTKCEFFRQTIEFLGYTITAGTTTPLIRNTDVIHAIPPPNNRKTLQSFLGAVNVYNKFIPDYARLRTPLNNLLKKDVTWDWDDKCQKGVHQPEGKPHTTPRVLKQVHSAGKAYPVQYFSRALRVHERNYTISELECLAIVESVEKFRVYLMGRKFTIFSDHHALQWLKTIKNPSGRLFRWSLRLSCYEYEVRYIKGSLQHEADLLSRNPFCGFLDATIIKNHQLTPSGESKLTIDRNGLQTLKRRGVTKIVVPDALVPDLLTKVHSRYNHPGISQMTRLISPQYYWKGMSEDISKTTKACAICQSTKPPRGPTFGELGQLPVATQPFDLVALDTIAGLAKYGNAKAYLHVVVDHFSRYTWTFPSKSTSLTTYQQVIKRVLQDGSPKRLLTDRAPAFTSPKFRKFLINRNIHPLLTTSNNPQANGLCERLNATLTGKLRLLHLENPKAAWTKLAKRVTVVYNNTPHSVTGFPPGYLMFGVLPPELTEHVNPYPVLTTARRIAHERTQAKHLKDKHAYDQQHKTPHFEPGDLVLVKVYHHPNTGKLAPYFTGPYEILEIISPNVVRINRPNQPLNRNTDTVHVNKLQYYNENIRYIAPPTLIPHPAKPQSRTLPPLFEHLTPDLFTIFCLRPGFRRILSRMAFIAACIRCTHGRPDLSREQYEGRQVPTATRNIISGSTTPVDLVRVDTVHNGPIYSFLSCGMGIMSDIDIESERLRAFGEARFSLYAIIRAINIKWYPARISFLPIPEWNPDHKIWVPEHMYKITRKQALAEHLSWQNCYKKVNWRKLREAYLREQADTSSDCGLPPLPDSNRWVTMEGDFALIYATYQTCLGKDVFFTPYARPNDGIIWLALIYQGVSRTHMIHILSHLSTGTYINSDKVDMIPVQCFRLEPLTSTGHLTIDGELIDTQPIQATVLPSVARVISRKSTLEPPENVIFSDDDSDRREQQSNDTHFEAGASSEPHLLTQGDLNDLEDEQLGNHVLSDVNIEEPAPDTIINRQTKSSGSDKPQRTRTIPKRFDDYVLATTNETIPKDYDEAIACEDKKHWENAMLEEIQNMYLHQVWELGLVHYEFVPECQTINQHYYLDVLRRLREPMRHKRSEKWHQKNWLLHHDNERPHTAVAVQLYLAKHGITLLPQLSYSTGLAPNDFLLYPKIKRVLKGPRFDSIPEIKENSKNILKSLKMRIFRGVLISGKKMEQMYR